MWCGTTWVCPCDTIFLGRVFAAQECVRFVPLAVRSILFVAILLPSWLSAEEYRVYAPHPRLLLSAKHLRLLQRERERQSMRWLQFQKFMEAQAPMAEPGLATALYAIVANDARAGHRAVEWALSQAANIRQTALVYDWCQDWITEGQSLALRAKLAKAPTGSDLLSHRDRILATIAAADDAAHSEEKVLQQEIDGWFNGQFAPELLTGKTGVSPPEAYALLELLHAIRDNLNLDLRDSARVWFQQLPIFLVLGNYPSPLEAPENAYRIPVFTGSGQPSTNAAALSRAAGLSLVAYDNNATETQFLQGWLIQDHFLMRGDFGAVYEFLWANPYQPGLSFFHLPLQFYDEHSGALFLRSSWEEDATWFGLFGGEAQFFENGNITVLNQKGGIGHPVLIGDASVVTARAPLRYEVETEWVFVVGLKPRRAYLVEVDDEELRWEQSDPAGTLALHLSPEHKKGLRLKEETNDGPARTASGDRTPPGKPETSDGRRQRTLSGAVDFSACRRSMERSGQSGAHQSGGSPYLHGDPTRLSATPAA